MVPFADGYHHPEDLRNKFKILSILDFMLDPSPDYRYHKFYAQRFPRVDLGIVDNGAGDTMFCFFADEHGYLIKGFDHNSSVSPHAFATGPHDFRPWPGMYEDTPAELMKYLEAPEFNKVEVTFCLWRHNQDQMWLQGNLDLPKDTDDGSSFLLGTIFMDAESYLDWGNDYYAREIPKDPVRELYTSGLINRAMASAINPTVDLVALERELAVMGLAFA